MYGFRVFWWGSNGRSQPILSWAFFFLYNVPLESPCHPQGAPFDRNGHHAGVCSNTKNLRHRQNLNARPRVHHFRELTTRPQSPHACQYSGHWSHPLPATNHTLQSMTDLVVGKFGRRFIHQLWCECSRRKFYGDQLVGLLEHRDGSLPRVFWDKMEYCSSIHGTPNIMFYPDILDCI